MKEVTDTARKYIEMAARQLIDERCPNYGQAAKDRIFKVSMMDTMRVSHEVLFRAIDLAAAAAPDLLKAAKALMPFIHDGDMCGETDFEKAVIALEAAIAKAEPQP